MGWDSEKQVAFDLLKEELMSDRVMAPPPPPGLIIRTSFTLTPVITVWVLY